MGSLRGVSGEIQQSQQQISRLKLSTTKHQMPKFRDVLSDVMKLEQNDNSQANNSKPLSDRSHMRVASRPVVTDQNMLGVSHDSETYGNYVKTDVYRDS